MFKIVCCLLFSFINILFAFDNYKQNDFHNMLLYNNISKIYEEKNHPNLFDSFEKIVYIGDSRTVGLSQNIENDKNILFICEIGKGLNWLKEQEIYKYNDDNTLFLINLGVNDLYNKEEYISYLKSLELKNLYYILVGPVDEIKEANFGYEVKNEDIEEFNECIKKNLKNIDLYSFLIQNKFETKDGIHYTNDTYKKIFEYLREVKKP